MGEMHRDPRVKFALEKSFAFSRSRSISILSRSSGKIFFFLSFFRETQLSNRCPHYRGNTFNRSNQRNE